MQRQVLKKMLVSTWALRWKPRQHRQAARQKNPGFVSTGKITAAVVVEDKVGEQGAGYRETHTSFQGPPFRPNVGTYRMLA